MKSLLFDIETDDLNATKIWCIVALDIDTSEIFKYGPNDIEKGIELLQSSDKLIGHNIIGFDIPVLKKLKGVDLYDKKIVDTLVLSRLFNPTREGNHSLESWGYRLNHNKIEFEEFKEYSEDMLNYCENDVILNYKIYQHLKTESKGFTKQSVEIEHKVARILNDQREKGFYFDIKNASILLAELKSKIHEVETEVKKEFTPAKKKLVIYPKYKKDCVSISKMGQFENGKSTRLTEKEYKCLLDKEANKDFSPIHRIQETEFNLGSRKQIGERLIEFGWKPKKFTPTGQPIVDEGTLNKVDIPQAKQIVEYLMLQKRIAQISSWLEKVSDDSRIRGFVNHNGTVTGRMTHRDPNAGQIPSTRVEYGKECRSCWTVPTGYKLVGIDASGLEIRMLAHMMNDKDFINEVLNGDIHTSNQRLAGLESRDKAKTFIYALCYGASDKRLSTILGGSRENAKRVRERFFLNLPSFKSLKDKVARNSKLGYLKGLDGRKLFVRSEHSALNTLLQGAGALVMKQALILFVYYIRDLDAHCVANVHDEWQVEVREDQADEVGKRGVQAIIDAGALLKLNCPLDGEYNVGRNWSETH